MIGRFTTEDPVFWEVSLTSRPAQYFTDPQQWNSYSYVRNNPINMVDPTGEIPIDTLTDAWFTLKDATKLAYFETMAVYNQYKANQNLDNYEVYKAYQDKANTYEQRAWEYLANLWEDYIAIATPYVSVGVIKIAKTTYKAAELAKIAKWFSIDSKIAKQMWSRWWDEWKITDALRSKDVWTTIDRATWNKATVYFVSSNQYVVINDTTKKVIQISNRNDKGWKVDKSITRGKSK